MSIRYVTAVLDGPQSLDGGKLKVLLALAEWSDDSGLSWHSIAEIARRARLRERATQYVLQQLEADGFLVIEQGHGRTHTSRYTLQMDALIKGAIGATILAPFNNEEKVQKVQNPTEKVQKTAIKGATAVAPEPSLTVIEPSINLETRARACEDESEFQTFEEFWPAFWKPYPKKVGKADALLVARSIEPKHWADIVRAVPAYVASDVVLEGYAKRADNWLLGEDWLEYQNGPKNKAHKANGRDAPARITDHQKRVEASVERIEDNLNRAAQLRAIRKGEVNGHMDEIPATGTTGAKITYSRAIGNLPPGSRERDH